MQDTGTKQARSVSGGEELAEQIRRRATNSTNNAAAKADTSWKIGCAPKKK